MNSRWYSIAVVLLWIGSMTWLVATKIVPSMLTGEPPSYQAMVESQIGQPPVGWRVWFKDKRIGWALSAVTRLPNETTEIRSQVHFDRIPLDELIPKLYRPLVPVRALTAGRLELETESKVLVDPLGHLAGFDAVLRVQPLLEVIKMSGTIKEDQLEVTVQIGTQSLAPTSIPVPELLADDLSPQTSFPKLRLGNSWWVRSYSFYGPGDKLQVKVEKLTSCDWDGHPEKAWLVVYRANPELGLKNDKDVRGRLWVRVDDGRVLKQEVMLGGGVFSFVRMTDQEAGELQQRQTKEQKAPAAGRKRHD